MKMLKEEKELRKEINWIIRTYFPDKIYARTYQGQFGQKVFAMRNAIIDNCVELIEKEKDFDRLHEKEDPSCRVCEALNDAIAAIQSRRGRK